jgi:hypothetical protein
LFPTKCNFDTEISKLVMSGIIESYNRDILSFYLQKVNNAKRWVIEIVEALKPNLKKPSQIIKPIKNIQDENKKSVRRNSLDCPDIWNSSGSVHTFNIHRGNYRRISEAWQIRYIQYITDHYIYFLVFGIGRNHNSLVERRHRRYFFTYLHHYFSYSCQDWCERQS